MKKENQPLQILNEKVLGLFEAVIDLIEEGVDINTIKVADITMKAGIGKGTAYEYFASKEEIIVGAIMWDMQTQFEEIRFKIMHKESLKGQILAVLNWIETNVCQRRLGIQFLHVSSHSYEIHESLHREFERIKDKCSGYRAVFNPIIAMGKKEGIIPFSMPDALAKMILISNFISFFMILQNAKELPDIPIEEAKEFVYGTIRKSFG